MRSLHTFHIFALLKLGFGEVEVHHAVKENEIMLINDWSTLEQNAKAINVVKSDNGIVLRSEKGNGSLININQELIGDSWSIEFTMKNLPLRDLEQAGLYLWYNDKPVEQGSYKGGPAIFNGFVTGIELSKDRADIVFAFNYGLDFTQKELQTMRYDHINPALIDHLDEFRIKVIHTERNFKIELYDTAGNLLSDTFRIHEPLVMNKGQEKKHFALTTVYKHCASDVFLELENLKILSREESEHYDIRAMQTEYNLYPRSRSDNELRRSVADAEHLLSYLTIVLGVGEHSTILEMVLGIKGRLRTLSEALDTASGSGRPGKVHLDGMRMNELETRAEDVNKQLEGVIERLKKAREVSRSKAGDGMRFALVLGIAFLVGSILRVVGEKALFCSAIDKKE